MFQGEENHFQGTGREEYQQEIVFHNKASYPILDP